MLDGVVTIEPTPRIERLRKTFFGTKPSGSIKRAAIETRVLKETEGEPMITRRAKVFAAVAREMPIDIFADELLVGYASVRRRCGNINPARTPSPGGLSEEDQKAWSEEIIPYWQAQGRAGKFWNYGHNVYGADKVIEKGFLGIKKQAEERLAGLDRTDPQDLKKVPFLEGVVIAMEAAAEVGLRYAVKARELAEKEPDATRKAELLKMAEVCDQVPANPARTFYEALQAYHFSWVLLTWEFYGSVAHSQGRIDQYLYPYYEADIREGRITPEEAQELLDCYLIQLNNIGVIGATDGPNGGGSFGVGGLKPDGNDATNDVSYMFIEAIMHTRMASPWFAVHIHSKSPDELLIKACQLSSLGTGHPQFLNSDVGVAQAMARGVEGGMPITLKDARTIANVGCLECVIPGKDSGYLYVAGHNLALALELALNNGVKRSDGTKVGVETGDPRQFKNFGDVQEAFRKQVAFMRENTQKSSASLERSLEELAPTVYESALIEGCIEKGLSKEEGGALYDFNLAGVEHGSTDAGDSLAAIKKFVFEEEKFTMGQLCDALDSNFVGHDDIRKMCLAAPKFGNDEDYVDELVAWVVHQWASEFRKLKNLRGRNGCPGGSPLMAYVGEGKVVGALPSGRLAGGPLAPAACPSNGKELKGPTGVFRSMGKLDGIEVSAGLSLTVRIDPAVFEKRSGIERMVDLMRTFVDEQIFHVQFNVTSSETLRAAQDKPEEYQDLMVKVAGYNAFFTHLNGELQDTIIDRTEHGL